MTETTRKGALAEVGNRHQRGREKREKVLLWLSEYQYSTTPILAKYLGVSATGQGAFFKRMVDDGILRKLSVPTVRASIFQLTREGRELACQHTEKALDYVTEPSKITVSTVQHNLCVQLAVLERLKPGMTHTFEKHMNFAEKDKLPDALLEEEGQLTALEIELSHKRTNRIYRAFYDHIQAMKNSHYHRVEYIFATPTLRNNYQSKFDASEWPVIERKAGKLRQSDRMFSPDTVKGLRERFLFVVQNFDEK